MDACARHRIGGHPCHTSAIRTRRRRKEVSPQRASRAIGIHGPILGHHPPDPCLPFRFTPGHGLECVLRLPRPIHWEKRPARGAGPAVSRQLLPRELDRWLGSHRDALPRTTVRFLRATRPMGMASSSGHRLAALQ